MSEFERKLDCLFEYYNSFRSHAEQRRNLLRLVKDGKFSQQQFSPSDRVELEHLEKLIDDSNEFFPTVKPLQDFKKELLKKK